MVSQGAHASLMAYLSAVEKAASPMAQDAYLWLRDFKMTKICVGIDSEAELLDLHIQAVKAGLPCSLVLDAAHTEFKEPTYTAVCIGPANSDDINKLTGHLKLL